MMEVMSQLLQKNAAQAAKQKTEQQSYRQSRTHLSDISLHQRSMPSNKSQLGNSNGQSSRFQKQQGSFMAAPMPLHLLQQNTSYNPNHSNEYFFHSKTTVASNNRQKTFDEMKSLKNHIPSGGGSVTDYTH